MPVKRNFVVGIMDDDMIRDINAILLNHGHINQQTSSHVFFQKQPLDSGRVCNDVTFFQLTGDSEEEVNETLNELIGEWDALETDYVLGDQDTSKILVFADFVGKVIICFDKVKFIEKGTFAKIDEMKRHKNELGYSKGFKPSFRPVEGSPVRGNKLENDVIYIISRTREDLLKYFDCLKAMILEIDSNLIVELYEYPR